MTYIGNSIPRELNMGLKKSPSTTLQTELCIIYTYDRGWNIYVYIYAYWHLYFYHWDCMCTEFIFMITNLYVEGFRVCCDHMWFLILVRGAPSKYLSLSIHDSVRVIICFNCILSMYHFIYDVLIGVFSMTDTTQYSKHYLLPIV